ncbi:hypothetical protein ACTNET_07665 [Lactobacillus amylovorus]|uniref:hypothetical protein n=1 Tax=Lactobacillus amylovorus TaxID=1604 RepID=UPI003F8BC5DA
MIYILCPTDVKTGGTELLHQLAFQLNDKQKKIRAQVVYYGKESNVAPVEAFKKYVGNNWRKESEIKDNNEDIFVIPETGLSEFNKFKVGKKYIWWLSVDNFYNSGFNGYGRIMDMIKKLGIYHSIGGIVKGRVKNYKNEIKKADFHLFQSYYAENFLKENGIPKNKRAYLSDYINDLYVQNSGKALEHSRKNVVLYNPKKGLRFTKKIINKSPTWIKWIPLINMSNTEVYENLISGKLYIDFGNHPGKDRFPREAAISGCCILTDKKGSAAYYKDIPILEKYKFEDKEENIDRIIKQIEFCLKNYSSTIDDFEGYREYIKQEKASFKKDVDKVFK